MIKVLYIVSTLKRSGPSNQLFNLLKYLDRNIFDPVIITLSPEPKETSFEKLESLNITIKSLNLSRVLGIFRGNKMLRKIVNEIHPDIIQTHGIRADSINAFIFSKKYKTVTTLRNYPIEDYTMKFGRLLGGIMARRHLKAIRNIHLPFACSKSISDVLKKNHNINLDYIQNGVDQSVYYPVDDIQKNKIRKQLNLSESKTIFVSVGGFIERKNNIQIINEFLDDIPALSNAILIILGDGPEYLRFKKLTKKCDNILLPGNVKNVRDYLQLSDFYISASFSEGLPNTVLEAMSCGLPVILSDIPQHNEIISYDSNSGILFPLYKKQFLIEVIDELSRRSIDDMKFLSKQIISKYLGAKIMSNQYQKKYIEIVTTNAK